MGAKPHMNITNGDTKFRPCKEKEAAALIEPRLKKNDKKGSR